MAGVRKAEVLYLGDASSIIKAAKAAQAANEAYATKVKASATEIVAAQDRVVAAGDKAAKASIVAGDSKAKAASLAGRAALKEAEAVGASTAEQVAAYRRATDAAVKASAEQSAAANRAAAAQVAAGKKNREAAAAFGGAIVSGAKKAGEGLLAFAATSVYAAVKFQKNMELMHTQAGASTAEVQKMSKAVLALGLSTEQGPNALAKALYPIESVGMRGATALAALSAAAKGAAVGQSDLTDTTHALAGVMVALHEKAGQAAKTMGAIDAVVGVGKMTMQDYVAALSSGIIPTAHAVGLSFNSIGAGLATLTDAGVPAEQAATKMRTILLMLAHEHTSAAVDGLKSVGLNADQLAAAMRKPGNGLLNVLELLSSHMSKLSNVKKVDLMTSLAGGSRSAGTLITLLDQMNRVGTKYDQIGKLSGQFNSRVAAESETASHRIKVAWSIIQTAFIEAGTKLLPVVSTILGGFEKFVLGIKKGTGIGGQFRDVMVAGFKLVKGVVTSIVGTINDVVRGFQQGKVWAVALVGAMAGFATALTVIEAVTLATKAWAVAQGILTIVMNASPIVLIGTALAVVVGALVALELKTHFVETAWKAVKVAFAAVTNWIGGAATTAFGIVKTAAEYGLLGPIGLVISRWNQIPGFFSGVWHAVSKAISSVAGVVFDAIKTIVMTPINFVKGLFSTIYDIGKYLITGLINGVESMAGKVLSGIKSVVMAPVNAVKGLLGINSPSKAFHDMGVNMMQGLANGLSSARGLAVNELGKLTSSIGKHIASGVLSTQDGATEIGTALNTTLKSFGEKPLALVQAKGVGASIAAAVAGGGSSVSLAGGGLVQFGRAGARGHDNIPARMGGKDIVVGSGEVGAVFNHTQQKVANHLLSPVGGLPGLFSNFTKPHYMASGGWVRTGATIDPTQGQAPTYSAHSGMSFAELLEAGTNAGMRPDLTALLGESRGGYGMPMETAIDIRLPGSKKSFQIWKNDVGSGQAGNSHFTIDLHQGIANALGWHGNADVEVAKAGTDPNAAVSGGGKGAAAVAAVAKALTAPAVKGSGTVATIVRSALGKMASAANAYVSKHQPKASTSSSATSSASVPSGGASSGPGGLAVFEGVTMAKWIANELIWATQHGWHGQPTSGYRPGFDPHTASGKSEHALINYPGGAVDFGGFTDPAAYATKLALVQLAARLNYPGPRLKMPIGFHDDGHLSGTGHAKGGLFPFAGAFKNGGVVPGQIGAPAMALVHGGEVIHAATGHLSKNPTSGPLAGISLAAIQAVYPLDAAIAELTAKIAQLTAHGAPTHSTEIAKLTDQLAKIAREKINPPVAHNAGQITSLENQLQSIKVQRTGLPSGKAGDAQRKDLAAQTLALEKQIRDLKAADSSSAATRRKALANEALTIKDTIAELKEEDKAAKGNLSTTIKNLTAQEKALTQLKSYTDAIATLKTQMKDLAAQAAAAWKALQQTNISKLHDAAISAINTGSDATTLAAMQAADTVAANAATLAGLQTTLTTAQNLAANSGGQTHLDALQQVKDAQAAIDAFYRQQTEQQLQDNITAATKKADDAQTAALAGLDQQTADYQQSLDNQLGALTNNLNRRKITYAQWAKAVDAILAKYGLSAATDSTTEQTVTTGPGNATVTVKSKPKKHHVKHHRASGGPVQPGYVYRVGEEGPEDVVFGQRGTVMTASQTRQSGRGDVHVNIANMNISSYAAAQSVADRIAFRASLGTA